MLLISCRHLHRRRNQVVVMLLQRINLVPQEPLSERIKRVTPWIIGLLLVTVIAGIFLQYQLVDSKLADSEKRLATLKSLGDQVAGLQAKTALFRGKDEARRRTYNDLRARISQLSLPQVGKNHFSQVLSQIIKVIPATVTFNDIFFNKKIGKISGTAVRPKDLPDFINNLKKESLFKDVVLLNIARDSGSSQYRLSFNIKFELN